MYLSVSSTREGHICIRRCVPLGPFLTLVLTASGACAHGSSASAPSPTRTFQTIDAAKACAREALISVGFLPETGTNPNSAGEITRAETATSINSQLITPLPDGKQVDYATAGARVQVGPKGDTTVTVGVTVQTLLWDDQNFGAVRPLSSAAVRARDAVQTRCVLVS